MMAVLASQGLPEGTMIDGWKVRGRLGAGGFGAVLQAEKNCRLYALKLALLPEGAGDDKKTHERALRELLCLLMLKHPNIVRVHGHGYYPDERDGHVYLALEYVEGWTLAEWIERTHPTAMELLRVFEKLAGAVAYMHVRGVFHRDLKLINVIIRKVDSEPILIDFGASAFAQAPEVTDGGLPPGTERGRAPEANRWWHAHRRKPKARYNFQVTDELFTFGVMLYDALTDPCPSRQRARTAVNSLLLPPQAPRERNPRIPVALASLVTRLLARDPARRPESFEAVRRELAELLEHQGPEYRVPVHAPSAQAPAVEQQAAGAGPREEPSPVKSRWRARRSWVAAGGVGLAVLAGATTYRLGRGLFPSAASPARSRVSLKKEPAVTTPRSEQPPPVAQQDVPRFASEAEHLSWCQAVGLGTLLAVNAGCPGAQLRPPPPGDCPAEAARAMREHGLPDGGTFYFTFGADPLSPEWTLPLKRGRVEAKVLAHPEWGAYPSNANLPAGTRLLGELWTEVDPEWRGANEGVYLRFDRVRLPGGAEFPVCLVSGGTPLGIFGARHQPDGTVRGDSEGQGGTVVYRWP